MKPLVLLLATSTLLALGCRDDAEKSKDMVMPSRGTPFLHEPEENPAPLNNVAEPPQKPSPSAHDGGH